MTPIPLNDDIEALAAISPAAHLLARRLKQATGPARIALVAEVAGLARLDTFRTLALVLKAEWEHADRPTTRWRPWETAGRHAALLPGAASVGSADGGLGLLALDLCAQQAHMAALAVVAELAAHDAAQRAVLARGDAEVRSGFARDKRDWLLAELQHDELVDLRQQLVTEIEGTRLRYLAITGAAAAEMVDSAHRLAHTRLRLALDDPTLTTEEFETHLEQVLADDAPDGPLGALEPELRLALQDSVRGIEGDRRSLQRIARLVASGRTQPASDEDVREATLLFRRLARLCHPDAIPPDARVSPSNRARLAEIWHEASATHGTRVQLSHDRIVGYVEHLRAWIAEAERIRRALAVPAPSRLLVGGTLEDLRADLSRAMADVQRHLHAVREDVSRLEFDPLHFEYRRVIALDPADREAECARMRERAQRWSDEAARLQAQLDAGPAASPASGAQP